MLFLVLRHHLGLCRTFAVCILSATIAVLLSTQQATSETSFSIGIDTGKRWFHEDALQRLGDAFFLGREVTGAVGRIEPQESRGISIRWVNRYDIDETSRIVSRVQLMYAETQYYLPDGAPPFADPITTRFSYFAFTPTIGFEKDLASWRRADFSSEVGFGADLVTNEGRLTSALLDVRSEDTFSVPHLYLSTTAKGSGRFEHLSVEARLQAMRNRKPDISFSVHFEF